MLQDASLGMTKADIGAMTSAFPAAYGAAAARVARVHSRACSAHACSSRHATVRLTRMHARAGVSKFLGGMLGAAFSPRLMLAVGLMATSLINVAFGFTSGVAWWTLMWAANGGIQVAARLCAACLLLCCLGCRALIVPPG